MMGLRSALEPRRNQVKYPAAMRACLAALPLSLLVSCSSPGESAPQRASASASTDVRSSATASAATVATTVESASASPSAAAQTPSASAPVVREQTDYAANRDWTNRDRKAAAEKRLPIVKELFANAGVAFPPAQVLFRVFKQENELELWAASTADGQLGKIATYRICYASGAIGPKRKEGDRQVPEGFYTLNAYTSTWKYHLMMYVSYPNGLDKIRGGPTPGGEIYIHGNCVSVGCIAMGDERIEELWLVAHTLNEAGGVVHLHVFPTRGLTELLASGTMPEHHDFWANLKTGYDYFEERRRLPVVSVGPGATYVFK
ncbi:MAG: L,D-transpeptidase family protein [Polyangiaceae bacterium]